MPINGMMLGSDLSLSVVDDQQGLLSWANIDATDFKQRTKQIREVQMNGTILIAEIPDGWTVSITITPGNSSLIDYIISNEETYYNGGTVGSITGQATMVFPDNSQRLYVFSGGAIKLTDAGKFAGQEKVTQHAMIEFARGQAAT